jgi:hypothetical protein
LLLPLLPRRHQRRPALLLLRRLLLLRPPLQQALHQQQQQQQQLLHQLWHRQACLRDLLGRLLLGLLARLLLQSPAWWQQQRARSPRW